MEKSMKNYTYIHTHTYMEEGMATHYSVLAWRIPMDRGAWWATVYRIAGSQTRLSD